MKAVIISCLLCSITLSSYAATECQGNTGVWQQSKTGLPVYHTDCEGSAKEKHVFGNGIVRLRIMEKHWVGDIHLFNFHKLAIIRHFLQQETCQAVFLFYKISV